MYNYNKVINANKEPIKYIFNELEQHGCDTAGWMDA